MRNRSEKIYKCYFNELTLVKMAYPKYHSIVTFFLLINFIFVAICIICLVSKAEGYLIIDIYLVASFVVFLIIIEYSRFQVIRKYDNENTHYDIRKNYDIYYNIRLNRFKQIIIDEKLYSVEGLKYLIDIYLKKSEKHKFKEFAVVAIVFASILQQFIDIIFFGNTEKLSNLGKYLVTNIRIIIPIVFVFIMLYILYKFFTKEALNYKSNNYKILANLLEETFLSEIICDLSSENNKQDYMVISSCCKQSCNKCRKYKSRININKNKKERLIEN